MKNENAFLVILIILIYGTEILKSFHILMYVILANKQLVLLSYASKVNKTIWLVRTK